ncbi:hypothetical protein [Burkholderia contaminans]|uniref:hypothetical protein n=1 Tax=Burkholderia contaminans TaxID=488447 RepID=UPI0012603DA7|nr:hypothetical protein [Burkholderia contaminans]
MYAVLDTQYDDTIQLMRNPHHVVADPVNVADFYGYMAARQNKEATNHSLLVGMSVMLLVLLAVAALVVGITLRHQ